MEYSDEMHEEHEEESTYEECKRSIVALATVIEALVMKVYEVEDNVSRLGKTIDEDLIGGAKKLAKATSRKMGIANVQSKYKEKFGKYEEPFEKGRKESGEELPEIYEQIFDILEDIKATPEYSEELENSTIEGLVEQFKERFPEIGEPAEEKMEAKEEGPKEEDGVSRAKAYVQKFLQASKAAGKQ